MTDVQMRWRLRWLPQPLRANTSEVILIAIDEPTEALFGRFGTGLWLSRRPFADQLRTLAQQAPPRVLAYDIILKEMRGQGHAIITETPAVLRDISSALDMLATGGRQALPEHLREAISLLVVEQSNVILTHHLASLAEQALFPVILGGNLRGGWTDPQTVQIPYWSETGNQGPGDLDYIRYLALPEIDVTFASPRHAEYFGYAPNGSLSANMLLDYSLPGLLNVPRDQDGVVRRVPLVLGIENRDESEHQLERFFVPSFALLSVMLHLGIDSFPLEPGQVTVRFGESLTLHPPGRQSLHIPIDDQGRMRLNYRWSFSDFDAVSFLTTAPDASSALDPIIAQALRNRLAVVGVTSTGIDVGPTPVHANIPLVYAQMTAINTILTQSFLKALDSHGIVLLLLGQCLLFVLLGISIRTIRVAAALLLTLPAYGIIAYGFLHFDLLILPVLLPIIFGLTSTFGLISYRYVYESRERRRIRGMFSTMVSDSVLSWLEDNPESFSLEGHMTQATVLFSDIANFTRLSEFLEPTRLVRLLNLYLNPVTHVILEAGGYLDKYVGDSVMAVWGAPYEDPRHAVKACRAALEQQQQIDLLNHRLDEEFGVRLHVRMGINSGEVTAGNMGSERKFQYTVVGDAVNLASRIEAINRETGTRIMLGEATQRQVADEMETRCLGRFTIVGRDQTVSLYELLGERGKVGADLRKRCQHYEDALKAYSQRAWDTAKQILEGSLADAEDGPSRWLLGQVDLKQKHPPPDTWNGEHFQTQRKH